MLSVVVTDFLSLQFRPSCGDVPVFHMTGENMAELGFCVIERGTQMVVAHASCLRTLKAIAQDDTNIRS